MSRGKPLFDKPLHELTIAEAAPMIRSGALSPVDLTRAFLDRIEAVDRLVRSYITVCAEAALAAARRAEREIAAGRYRGPLHGIPYGLKDNFMARGIRATANSRLMLDQVPDDDATAHLRLQQAGAILLGKLHTYEYGTGNGDNLFELPFAPTRNPWNLGHFPGGSTTGGGAAVAAGTAMFALGADTGGSIRLPAAACGASGLKPTYGLVSRAGVLPNCYSLDCIGPIAWTAQDAGLVLQVIAGLDTADPASADVAPGTLVLPMLDNLRGLRIGVVRRFHQTDIATAPELAAGFEGVVELLASLGATIVEREPPYGLLDFRNCSRIINASECLSIHEADYRTRRQEMGIALRDKLSSAEAVTASDYIRAQRWRRILAGAVDRLFETCDLVICAGATRCAPSYEDRAGLGAFTTESAMAVFSLSGHPAISLCSGFSEAGLPLNLQLAGRRFGDGLLAAAAALCERCLGLKSRRPDLSGDVLPSRPAWADAPPPDVDAMDRAGLAAQDSMKAVIARLPAILPKSIEPFVTVDTRITHGSE